MYATVYILVIRLVSCRFTGFLRHKHTAVCVRGKKGQFPHHLRYHAYQFRVVPLFAFASFSLSFHLQYFYGLTPNLALIQGLHFDVSANVSDIRIPWLWWMKRMLIAHGANGPSNLCCTNLFARAFDSSHSFWQSKLAISPHIQRIGQFRFRCLCNSHLVTIYIITNIYILILFYYSSNYSSNLLTCMCLTSLAYESSAKIHQPNAIEL